MSSSRSFSTLITDGVQGYSWLVPGESLPERRSRAEGRREELLHLLYEDKLNTGQSATDPRWKLCITLYILVYVYHEQYEIYALYLEKPVFFFFFF